MLKIIPLPTRLSFLKYKNISFFSNQNQKPSLVPSIIDNTEKFYKNVYGVALQRHILPYNIQQFSWTAQQMKNYRKKLPSYIVILIKRVLQTAEEINTAKTIQNMFYPVATYCKIKYYDNRTQLQSLYRVKVKSIEEIQQGQQQKQPAIQQKVIIHENEDQQEEQNEGIQQLSGLTLKKQARKLNLKIYSLQIEKYEQRFLNIDHNIEIRLKYLIQFYKSFLPIHNKYRFLLFNPNESLKNIYIVTNQMIQQNYKPKQIQEILQENDAEQKMNLIHKYMNKVGDWKSIYQHIQKTAQNNLKNKKFYQYYSQIFKIAKQSIDGKSSKKLFIQKITKDFYDKKPPQIVKQIFQQQKQKYIATQQSSSQSGIIKKYLQDLSKIPYSIKSQQIFDLQHAQKVLEQQHYGMKQVKDAILQIIAVGKLKGTLKGKVFCLIGGPGLGKTTIAKSIAKALGRKFYNISLGGVTDSSVLKGHRRTYVGAYAGKIIEALKNCETNNPVILLDEIDKMGSGYHGDPRSQLLQILDPNQNQSFIDNYIDVSVDLSNVLFVCSANYQKNISKPLLDRVEKIRLTSYTDDQKKQIFKRHLLRRAINKSGIKDQQFQINNNVIDALIYDYSLGQPGVRRLQKNIQIICQKIAYKIVEGVEGLPIKISRQNLSQFLGNSYFRLRDHTKISKGVAISLGGGDYGSRLTYIQSFKKSFVNKKDLRRSVMFTGSLGDIFKQAMNISYTFARTFLLKELNNTFLFNNQVHIHAPDGASKKDGSMDSLTICSSLVSLAIEKPVRKGFAMTGQITLHGKVLRTHGIKEKILLGRRQKIWNLIIPEENRADVSMLASSITEGFNIFYVKTFRQVYKILFEYQQSASQKQEKMENI